MGFKAFLRGKPPSPLWLSQRDAGSGPMPVPPASGTGLFTAAPSPCAKRLADGNLIESSMPKRQARREDEGPPVCPPSVELLPEALGAPVWRSVLRQRPPVGSIG